MIRDRCPMCGQVLRTRKGPPRSSATEEVGKRLREARFNAGMTLADVATRCDPPVTQPAVSQWESGDRTLTVDRLVQLARLYGIPVGDLFVEGAVR